MELSDSRRKNAKFKRKRPDESVKLGRNPLLGRRKAREVNERMKHVFKSEQGTVVLDSSKDTQLYESPHNPPNTGSTYTRGTDLYAHRSRKGNVFFYLIHWSMWQGEETRIQPIDLAEATSFLRAAVGDYWNFGDDDNVKACREFGIELLEETA